MGVCAQIFWAGVCGRLFGRPVGVCAQNSLAGVCGGSHPHLDPRMFSVFLSYSFAIFILLDEPT